ncbi:MAG: ABC transporter ATP-binding protein [Anaerolineae bacterium]|nr:ABC transporter ATP-binding protein [Anaerolineae bacterium]
MLVYDIHDLTKIYPGQTRPANDRITLQIEAGEVFGLLGENGAGKSTLVRQMANLTRSTSGSITLFGAPVDAVGADPLHVPRCVGYMPQEPGAMNLLTIGEALYFTAHLRGLSRADARRERDRLLDLWGIGDLRDRATPRLSGGQRRLLRLAVAMAGMPPVLILDEPTNDLDPQRRKMVWDNLRRLNHEQGTTIIFVTHDAIEAEKIIQRVCIMRDGRVVALGRPGELKQRVDQKLRLELFFAPGAPPRLPDGFTPRRIEPGRWLVLLERAQIGETVNGLDLDRLDDFRLYSATLEDLYLHYANDAHSTQA